MLLWGNRLSGSVVHVYCDNTAAVSWIHNSRGNVHAVGLIPLLRLLTIYCFIKKITLISSHLPGVENILADKLSRELFDTLQDCRNRMLVEELKSAGALQETVRSSNYEAHLASLESTTWSSSRSALRSWMRFSQLFEIDVALGGGIDSVRNYETKEILRILIQYIGCEVGVRRLSPDSKCGSYVYNIINKFIVNG